MRKLVVIFIGIILILASNCGNISNNDADNTVFSKSDTGTAQIIFREYEHNFGKVAEGEKVGCVFSFENEGTGSLVITSATTSCGCTVPKYSTKPIMPGENGTLEVVFDTSGRNGIQTKTITIKSNASTPVVLLRIVAEVETNNN
jgi:Protein of unknown function (DUF1573)